VYERQSVNAKDIAVNLSDLRVRPQPIQYVANGAPLRNNFVRNRDMKFIFERHPDLDAIEAAAFSSSSVVASVRSRSRPR
jgi:hypothetical protein